MDLNVDMMILKCQRFVVWDCFFVSQRYTSGVLASWLDQAKPVVKCLCYFLVANLIALF